ncbi:hypothetical protein F511_40214 [Dorcoceras hygrometricum]|uniref:Uncharacterized protein n=1 Tax=Dorcoceras hygrometricum TaxID=472368 RepID=A0A2Z7BV91_9LAMI|nr:hypothetical protein F511_40214 [Dorcoceras hygrometricum]
MRVVSMNCLRDQSRVFTFVLPAPAITAGALPAGPPPGPDGSNVTDLASNRDLTREKWSLQVDAPAILHAARPPAGIIVVLLDPDTTAREFPAGPPPGLGGSNKTNLGPNRGRNSILMQAVSSTLFVAESTQVNLTVAHCWSNWNHQRRFARAVDRYDDVGVTYSLLLVVDCVVMVAADQQARKCECREAASFELVETLRFEPFVGEISCCDQQMNCFGERAVASRFSFCLRELLSAGELLRRRVDKLERCRFEVLPRECLLFAPADFIEGKELVPTDRYLLVLSAALIISRPILMQAVSSTLFVAESTQVNLTVARCWSNWNQQRRCKRDALRSAGFSLSRRLMLADVALSVRLSEEVTRMNCFGERAVASRWSFCLREKLSAGELLRRRLDKLERCRFEVLPRECLLFAPADFIEEKELVPADRYLLVLSAALIISRRWIWGIINRSVVRHLELFLNQPFLSSSPNPRRATVHREFPPPFPVASSLCFWRF